MAIRISIQGYEGSFHQVAAQSFFGQGVQVIPCATFREVVKLAASKREADGGVMAIENSIAGSILPNYNLLQKSHLKIAGEVYLRINQNLLVNHGVQLEDIKEVHSHHMALQQCIPFLDKYNWKLVETEDTALSAKHIHQHRSKHIAAIASKLAAEIFDLTILAPKIQSEKANYTRFLVLQKENEFEAVEAADKATIHFTTNHTKGSLAKVLTAIAKKGVNLSKLQSMPIPGSDWQYSFHADLEFENINRFHTVVDAIQPLINELKILGVYKKGATIN